VELDVPNMGLYSNPHMPLPHVKYWLPFDRLINGMMIQWRMIPGAGLSRCLVQELTKPVNIRLPMNKNPGFSYKVKTKENVIISRLLVDLNDLEDNITQLMNEANRFYILYCFPAS
jgi:hypothetical protein